MLFLDGEGLGLESVGQSRSGFGFPGSSWAPLGLHSLQLWLLLCSLPESGKESQTEL